ncbi:MAG: ATP-binding cassette domain-containing protein [Calditrichaeota bacterium]|nr:ATP-binding cassette domain-containing protein [Calditrichota bacterium]RQW02271.1 MAG: ATP-binding cassette domain-containing protein [Calditrichota bacterium]
MPDQNDTAVHVKVQDLEMRYNNFLIQKNLNFEIRKGEIFMIAGSSGSGKSTLLRHLIGLMKPVNGKIFYHDRNLWDMLPQEQKALQRRMGILYQSAALWSSLTLGENIAILLENFTDYDQSEIRHIVEFKLALVGLAGYQDYYPSDISGGMRKRAGLARAMALDPDIFLFDEPTAGLDPVNSQRLDSLIKQLRDNLGTTVVVVSHELDSIFAIGDTVIFLDSEEKTITGMGVPADLRDHPPNSRVSEFFNRENK